MVKGKPWTGEEENQLRQMLKAERPVRAIARALGKTRECVRVKIARLGLDVVVRPEKISPSTTTTLVNLKLPEHLPSVEEQLKVLAAAIDALRSSSLGKEDVLRLRAIIQGIRVYQEKLAEYVDYRGIEAKVIDLEAKYARLLESKEKNTPSGLASPKMDKP